MTELGSFTYFLGLTALILMGSIGWLLLTGRILLPLRQNKSRSRRKINPENNFRA